MCTLLQYICTYMYVRPFTLYVGIYVYTCTYLCKTAGVPTTEVSMQIHMYLQVLTYCTYIMCIHPPMQDCRGFNNRREHALQVLTYCTYIHTYVPTCTVCKQTDVKCMSSCSCYIHTHVCTYVHMYSIKPEYSDAEY